MLHKIKEILQNELPYLKKALRAFFAALPPAILYYKTENTAWFSVALVCVACCIPYGSKDYSAYRMVILCISYDILFIIQTYALHIPFVYGIIIFVTGFFYVYITRHNSNLRQYLTWIFIPSLYSAIEFHEKIFQHINHYFLERIYFTPISFLCAFISCFVLFPEKKIIHPIKKFNYLDQLKHFFLTLKDDIQKELPGKGTKAHPVFRQSLRTACAVLFSFCIVYFFHFKEGQWLIWSCASIILTYTDESIKKTKQRFLGLVCGIGIGFLLVQALPQNPFLTLIFSFLIFLSLSGVFKSYAAAFATRCALIMATGATIDGSVTAGIERFENVTLGIIVGTLATYFLWPNKERVHLETR